MNLQKEVLVRVKVGVYTPNATPKQISDRLKSILSNFVTTNGNILDDNGEEYARIEEISYS